MSVGVLAKLLYLKQSLEVYSLLFTALKMLIDVETWLERGIISTESASHLIALTEWALDSVGQFCTDSNCMKLMHIVEEKIHEVTRRLAEKP